MSDQLMITSLNATYFLKLLEICGYVQNSSETVVTISQDDGTNTFQVEVRGYGKDSEKLARKYWGKSLQEAINKAYDAEVKL